MRADDIEVIAPNLKRRWSGVTSTVFRLVPVQRARINIACTGPNLPSDLPQISLIRLLTLPARPPRVWHARRNIEMLAGLGLKWILRKNLKLLFTSAAQRRHSGYTRWLLARMDRVVATSSRAAAYLDGPSTVILHGVDTDRFRPAAQRDDVRDALGLPDRRLVGCFGRIRHQKGTDRFVDVMLRMVRRFPDVAGVILGGTTADNRDFHDDLKARVASEGQSDKILFLGEQPDAKVPEFFRALDLFVAPQRWEGFGLTPLEAMASGVPVVTTRAGAFEDMVVQGETGLIVDTEDDGALMTAVNDLLDDPDRMAEMGRCARAHILENFSLDREAAALVDIYREMLADRPAKTVKG
ncbi:MAG: glycosyltransferase family 4 protein, partial [Marinibacterium sp.]